MMGYHGKSIIKLHFDFASRGKPLVTFKNEKGKLEAVFWHIVPATETLTLSLVLIYDVQGSIFFFF